MKKIFILGLAVLLMVAFTAPDILAQKEENWNIIPSIKYQFIPRPSEVMTDKGMGPLPADMVAPAGVRLRFINIKAIDDFLVSGALWEPEGKEPSNTVAFVNIHGSGGNYYYDPIGFVTRMLSAKGYACLAINTRQHDKYINTDNFFDIRKDIEAAVLILKTLGYKKIIIHGHSLGNIQVQYYVAVSNDPAIKAVVLTGPFANLPWKSRNILINNEAQYNSLYKYALEYVKTGRGSEVLPIEMGYLAGGSSPVTAQHFMTYRSTETSIADGTFWIRRIPVPILMVRDAGDFIIRDFEPHWLLNSATAPGSLVPNIKFVLLPNPKGPNPRGHGFSDNREPLVDTIAKWLVERGL